jgi:hypothetical protein
VTVTAHALFALVFVDLVLTLFLYGGHFLLLHIPLPATEEDLFPTS